MVNPGPRGPHALIGLGLSGAIIIADQITKWLVLEVGKFSPPGCLEFGIGCRKIEISGIFDLTMVWNRGISFGLFDGGGMWGRVLLSVFALGVAAFLAHWLWSVPRRLSAIALGMIIGGAIGNVIDRVRFGAVVDFFDFSGLFFPYVFNIADAAISVGVGLFLLDLILDTKPRQSGKP